MIRIHCIQSQGHRVSPGILLAVSCLCLFPWSVTHGAKHRLDRHPELERLGWTVGEWTSSGSGQSTEMSSRWSEDGSFLLVDVRVRTDGSAEQFSTERIAWDPAAKNIRSWIFRNDGSFGESVWTSSDKGWQAKTRGVAANGLAIRGTVHWQPMEDGRLGLRSDGVKIGSENVPDVEILLTRSGDPPGPMPGGKASPIENVQWELYEMNGVPMEFDRPPTIQLKGGKLEAVGFINRIGGTGELNGTSLKFSRLMATRMGGPPEIMELESAFTQMLESVDSFQLEGHELQLTRGQETVARFRQ